MIAMLDRLRRISARVNSLFMAAIGAMMAMAEDAERPAPMPVGGQAVIDGVVMKGYSRWGLAVRDPKGEIVTENWPLRPLFGGKFSKIPVVRGFFNMIEMMRDGFKALSRSTDISLGEEEEMSAKDVAITVIVAVVLVIGLFVALPVWLAEVIRRAAGCSAFVGHVIEGCLRGLVFVVYIAAIGLWKDMARVLAYHGAEHKTINAYENNLPLTPESVAGCTRLHPRCGTSFLLIVVVISIIVFSLAGSGGIVWRICLRVCLLPVVVGLSYEFIRAMWRWGSLGRILMALPMTLQYLTTREPTADQIEVGIRSLEEALDRKFI